MSDSHEFKIQYVDDLDPFNVLASIKHVEPTVPKKFKVLSSIPLIDQLGSVKKALRAPHKVSLSKCQSTPNTVLDLLDVLICLRTRFRNRER
jgi:hypothetical protein